MPKPGGPDASDALKSAKAARDPIAAGPVERAASAPNGYALTVDSGPGARPDFCAGVVLDGRGIVVRAAPIIRYMIGWTEARVVRYARQRGWRRPA